MKRIDIPDPVPLVDFEGEPIPDGKGEPAPPLTFAKFARQLIRLPKFTEGVGDSFDADDLVDKVRLKVSSATTHVDLEDEEHRRLLAALRDAKLDAVFAACVRPHRCAIRDARDHSPAVLAEKIDHPNRGAHKDDSYTRGAS